MRDLTERLIAAERGAGGPSDTDGRAAFRVCEKLRRPLGSFAGAAGFRSLLSRALALAKPHAPLLGEVQLMPNGALQYSAALAAQLDTREAGQAAAALTDELLGLLFTFIGETLTLRLVHDVWPKAASQDSPPEGD